MGSRRVKLSQGKFALVDEDDYEKVLEVGKWTYHIQGYAYRFDRSVKPNKCILMHRFIADTPQGMVTDHINRDKLDNRKSNLRAVSGSANSLNRVTSGVESSKYWNGYVIRISADGIRHYFGRYKDKEEAMAISECIKEQLLEAIV